MKKITKYYKRLKITYIKATVLVLMVSIFFLPNYIKIVSGGNNLFDVSLNGEKVGTVGSLACADEYLRDARREIAENSDELVLMDTFITTTGKDVLVGAVDSKEDVTANMKQVLEQNKKKTLNRSFTVKINEYSVNVASSKEVRELLQAAMDKYAPNSSYEVDLDLDTSRELNVLTTKVEQKNAQSKDQSTKDVEIFREAGAEAALTDMLKDVEPAGEKEFSDYKLGLVDVAFWDTVEVTEAYLPEDKITPLETAIQQVTKDQEKETIYEVSAGDSLSLIAENNNLTIEDLIGMNPTIENENSTIRIGDEMIVTVPEPELSIERKEQNYYEENYDAEIQYVDNDEWYTNEQVTLQEPSAGHHNVIALVTYRNEKEIAKEIVKEEITMDAVPKIVERGTKIPPTYIKPISGGRMSSTFGKRKAPKRGASTFHKGIDWSTPVGTAVAASSAGTVVKAGWGSGYGYVVYINHADGRQTRYGHLSKVLVKVGSYVQQGQKIALSGNTGVSTGPHVHFEILVNGCQVNPLDYLN